MVRGARSSNTASAARATSSTTRSSRSTAVRSPGYSSPAASSARVARNPSYRRSPRRRLTRASTPPAARLVKEPYHLALVARQYAGTDHMEIREVRPAEYEEAGRVTASAYREF